MWRRWITRIREEMLSKYNTFASCLRYCPKHESAVQQHTTDAKAHRSPGSPNHNKCISKSIQGELSLNHRRRISSSFENS